jgi:hypothetical protein
MEPSSGSERIWIGMVEVRPFEHSELLADALGAFVHVLTWAANEDEYGRKVRELLDHLHLEMVDIQNAEPLENRRTEGDLDPEIARIAAEVRCNQSAIMYGTFHTWAGPIQ